MSSSVYPPAGLTGASDLSRTTGQPTLLRKLTLALLAAAALVATSASPSAAQDAQWSPTAATGDFNTASNWMPATVPTGSAFFGQSAVTTLFFSQSTTIGGIQLNPGASNYTFNGSPSFNGAGIVIQGGGLTINNSGLLTFPASSSAGSATINNDHLGGVIRFSGTATGGTVSLNNDSRFHFSVAIIDVSAMTVPLSVGSISGGGLVFIGATALSVGAGDKSSEFDGNILEGGVGGGTGGSLTKIGAGTLILGGVNSYTGGTTISGGTLGASSQSLGTGPVTINGSILRLSAALPSDILNPIQLFGSSTVQIPYANTNVSLTGGVTGTGNLIVDTTRTAQLGLKGTNTYSGSTTITAGSNLVLQTTGSITQSSQLNNSGFFTIQSGASATFGSATNSPGGQIVNLGFYQDDLTNAGTFTNSGTFVGNIAGNTGTFTNNAGATVTGNVNDGGIFINNGTVSGTLTVTGGGALTGTGTIGNLAFASGAVYLVTLNGATASSTTVTGTGSLNGSVTASALARIATTTTYTILNAGSLTGTFTGATSANNFARNARLSYSGTTVFLTVDPGLLSPALPGSANMNQRNVAAGIDNGATGVLPAGFNTLFALASSALPAALTQLTGEVATAAQQTTFNAMTQFLGVMSDPTINGRGKAVSAGGSVSSFAGAETLSYAARDKSRPKSERDAYAAMARKAPPPVADAMQRWSVWGSAFGGSQTTDGDPALGSNRTTSRAFGGAVGADYRFAPDTLAGFALAGGGTDFRVDNSGTGRSDLFQAGAFVRQNFGPAYISAALAYGWQDVTTNRTVTIAGTDLLQGRFNASALSGRGEGGYRFVVPVLGGFGLTPYVAGQFTTFWLPGYTEAATAGSNQFALTYGARTITDTRSELGFRTDKSYALAGAILTLRGREAWVHDYNPNRSIGDTFLTLPGASFVVNGATQPRDAWLSSASAELNFMNGWSLAAVVDSEWARHARSYAGKGVVRYVW